MLGQIFSGSRDSVDATHERIGSGITPVHNASWGGPLEVSGLLTQYGADPTLPNRHGRCR